MDIEIMAVGTELLLGQIANTNAQYISRRLPEAGANVYFHSVVGDNPARLRDCLDIAFARCDTVITTGGLGPTEDDLTKETLAAYFHRELLLDEPVLEQIRDFFKKRNRPMPNHVAKQARMPAGSRMIPNSRGTAPGCIIEEGGRTAIILPGPPSEMIPMFEDTVMPYLVSRSPWRIVSRFIKFFGIGESLVEERLLDLVDAQKNPTLATYVKEGEVILRITARCDRQGNPEALLDPVLWEVKARLGDYIYDTDGRSMEEVLSERLRKAGRTLSLAESCTGGLLGASLTEWPGASDFFLADAVCYSNKAKTVLLGVSPEILEKYGAVSEETAVAMAEGIRCRTGSDYGLSVTGIAGPGGGTEGKPVGTVCIALAEGGTTRANTYRLAGDRTRIRNLARLHAFDMLLRRLSDPEGDGTPGPERIRA